MNGELLDVELPWQPDQGNGVAGKLITEALKRIDCFRVEQSRIPSFETSNFFAAAGILQSVMACDLVRGKRFCEWGSGFGVVTCLAAQYGFEACGIEIESVLVEVAKKLARDYDLNCEFYSGSYLPKGAFSGDINPSQLDKSLGFSPYDFDVIYAYPWPAELDLLDKLFCRFAVSGTLLISYHGGGRFRVQRRVGASPHIA